MSVERVFYPENEEDILSSFDYFNDIVSKQFTFLLYNKKIKALIVPHAGYIYSGFSANLAYRNVNTDPKRVVVIGPSHRDAFEGISLKEYNFYETPLGNIEADSEYIRFLKSKFHFVSFEHKEHSTEVQFPFVKHYFPKATLVELVYGQNADLDSVIEEVMQTEDTLLLVSTDLSHFYNQKKANKLDSYCIEGIEKLDIGLLKKGEACGMQGVISLLNVAKKMDLHVKSIDYRTSGDITGDKDRVVGYYSAIIYKGRI
jgi:AmmeMemoRadiSam system protein B